MASKIVYYLHQYWIDIGDKRSEHFFLVGGGLWKIVSVLLTYWMLVKVIIPYYMRDRKPYSLVKVMRVYNTIMVFFNAWIFYQAIRHCDYGRAFVDFQYPERKTDPETLNSLSVFWFAYMSRFMDLLDTIFFALRKKDRQISFLHVYHHMMVPFIGWYSFKLNPLVAIVGLFGLINAAIHVIMYTYYSLASFGPAIQKYLWWKRYITQLQLIQFVILGVYAVTVACFQTGYPASWFGLVAAQNPIFFYMFFNFYRKSYNQTKKPNFANQKFKLNSVNNNLEDGNNNNNGNVQYKEKKEIGLNENFKKIQ